MSKLVRGDQLPSNLRREVLSSYLYRWTSDNPQRERAWQGIKGAPTIPLITDEQWLREHAFYVTDRGTLDKKRKHAEPVYMAEDTSKRHHATRAKAKSPAQLDREIAEVLANPRGTSSRPHFTKFDERQGDWFSLSKFREMIVDGRVFDEDGAATFGKLDGGQRVVSNVPVDLSRFATPNSFHRSIPSWATGVVWKSRRSATSHARKVTFAPGDPKRYPGYAIASGTQGDDGYYRSKKAARSAAKRLANEKNRRVEVARISKNQDRQIVDEVYPSRW